MEIRTHKFGLRTQGNGEMQDITSQLSRLVSESGVRAGIVTAFVPGSTAGLTTIEFEPGAAEDFRQALNRVAPPGQDYRHHQRWGDDNGHSHVQASLLGPSLTVPVADGRMTLGQWQQVVLVDFDTHGRSRDVVVQIMGE